MPTSYSKDTAVRVRRRLTPDGLLVRDDMVCTFCMDPVSRHGWAAFSIEPFTMVYRKNAAEKRITVTCEPACHPLLSDGLVDPVIQSQPYQASGMVTCASCRGMIDRAQWGQLDQIAARHVYRALGRSPGWSHALALAWAQGEHAMYRLHRVPGPWRTFDDQ
jgi:hypothetical protein